MSVFNEGYSSNVLFTLFYLVCIFKFFCLKKNIISLLYLSRYLCLWAFSNKSIVFNLSVFSDLVNTIYLLLKLTVTKYKCNYGIITHKFIFLKHMLPLMILATLLGPMGFLLPNKTFLAFQSYDLMEFIPETRHAR